MVTVRVRRGRRQRRVSTAVVIALLAVGCGSDASDARRAGAALDDLPELELREVRRIGSAEDPDYGFSQIGPVRVGPEGWVWVMETQAQELRAYTPGGELVRVLGGPGEGPGEFGRLQGFGIRGDTVWAYDPQRRRLTRFNRGGELLSTAPVEELLAPLFAPGEALRMRPGTPDPDGLFVGRVDMRITGQGESARDSVDVPIVRFDADGQVVDTVGWYPEFGGLTSPERISVGQSAFPVPQPPSPDRRWDYTSTELLTIDQLPDAEPPTIRLTRMTLAGDTIRSREFEVRTRPFPDALLDSLAVETAHSTGTIVAFTGEGIEMIERRAEDTAAARVEVRRAMDFPQLQPPVRGHHLTSEGAVWIERERRGDGFRRWTVFGPEDQPVGWFRLPSDVRLARADSEGFWAVERDELDVPWLVRYEFPRADEGARRRGTGATVPG